MKITLQESLLNKAKRAFSCRRVDINQAKMLIREPYQPQAGDVVLAKVQSIGQHRRIELANGRKSMLTVGDLVILAYGNRYAPDQFEGLVPKNLSACDMVAAGGIAADAVARKSTIDRATRIQPLGVLADSEGKVINLKRYRLAKPTATQNKVPVLVVAGTSMNAGKTFTAACLIRGLSAAGLQVGATKLTGTGAGGDFWAMLDAGAKQVLDFTDTGLASTYLCSKEQLLDTTEHLFQALVDDGVDIIVAEIADGVGQQETCELLTSSLLRSYASGIVFAAGDAMGGSAGYQWLSEQDLPVLAISGLMTTSPLAMRELSNLVPVPAVTANELCSPLDLGFILPEEILSASNQTDFETQPQPQTQPQLPPELLDSELLRRPRIEALKPAVLAHASPA